MKDYSRDDVFSWQKKQTFIKEVSKKVRTLNYFEKKLVGNPENTNDLLFF